MRDEGQLQIVEAITVAVFLFTAIAVSSLFRIPTSPSTFQEAELERLSSDALRVLTTKRPDNGSDCNQGLLSCPFANGSDLERMLSLSLGYVGTTSGQSGESANSSDLSDFLNQSLPDGVRYVAYYTNAVETIQIAPAARTPPTLNVVVAHAPIAPNWTVYADNVRDSVLVRIGEDTGFGTATSIHDPLNRTQNEFGGSYLTTFMTTVPDNATLGTYELCSPTCKYFTVTPPGIFGAGSRILGGDRDNSTNIKLLGDFYDFVEFNATDANYDASDGLYIDADNTSTVTIGDIRLTALAYCRGSATCAAGSSVIAGDSDNATTNTHPFTATNGTVRGVDVSPADSQVDDDQGIYLVDDGDFALLDATDRRLSRVGVNAMGSLWAGTDSDVAASPNLPFASPDIYWADLNNDGFVNASEPVYLDLEGNGLGAGDFHVNPNGSPTVRYYYDVRLVVWYGI